MLKKFLCKKCLNMYISGFWDAHEAECNANWAKNKVCCPFKIVGLGSILRQTDEPPPEWCPYKVEHVLL